MSSISWQDWLAIIGFIIGVIGFFLTTLAMKNKDIRIVVVRTRSLFRLVKFVTFFILPVWGLYVLFVLLFNPGIVQAQDGAWLRLLIIFVVIVGVSSDIRDVLNEDKRAKASLEAKESLNNFIEAGEE
jgi:hypothetical protein